ncbi:hypothetical protein K435DRAFT_821101 [Dendrothele bispora CBS 962.96]|uniref:WW domain-containing protein n=1 Tax=Dendrothele bispora (strain CBS 962.96) TaxID=1314807 RepID=A0A4S8LNJ5_DENBC|nr:hypothetical protein K435DRAFT_821101 [Dendrothele bispora CBS 962.96]
MPSTPTSTRSSPEETKEEQSKTTEESTEKSSNTEQDSAIQLSKTEEPVEGSSKETEETPTSESSSTTPSTAPNPSSNPWQAVYSPQYNAYYFYNSETNETTWQNPLVPADTSASSSDNASAQPAEASVAADSDSASTSQPSEMPYNALETAAIAQGIDPSLAYLDPSLAGPSGTGTGGYGATAKFNARTGAFTRVDARDPSHLSEYERAKRMSEAYFDVSAWEEQKVKEQEEEVDASGRKRKRPTKKDLERFKEQKKQKKIAKTAWLRT